MRRFVAVRPAEQQGSAGFGPPAEIFEQLLMSSPRAFVLAFAAVHLMACSDFVPGGTSLSKRQGDTEYRLSLGQRVPDTAEASAIGPLEGRVRPGTAAFAALVRCDDLDIVFKDEERTGADRMMTRALRDKLRRLSTRVSREWPNVKLRVTEAWDERREHGENSVHYEGRAADITTSDVDTAKLGRLARLAVISGLDWVFYEDASHVHVSVAR
jgi:hypothetical protein